MVVSLKLILSYFKAVSIVINFYDIIVVIGRDYLLCYFPHSLSMNSIGDEGAVAIAKAVKKMNNLQRL